MHLQRMITCALALGALASCQNYPFVFQENQRSAGRAYRIDVGVAEATDILFVVDNSGSMAEEQAELRANIDAFVRVLTESPNDYQVGLVSTDIFKSPPADDSCSPCCDIDTDGDDLPDYSDCDDGRLYAADFQTRIFSRPSGEGKTEAELDSAINELIAGFNETIEALGTGGSAFEAPLEAMRRALDPEGDPAVRLLNRGFLRPQASLAIIFLTDEDDCSFPSEFYAGRNDDVGCYTEEGALAVNDFIDFLIELKGSVEAVRAASIVGGVASDTTDLGFAASGCYSTPSTEGGLAANDCGCWTSRFVIDPRDNQTCSSNDFFCNYLAEPPFSQTCERTPLDPSGQGGCIALPGSRLVTFVDELRRRRVAAQLSPGVVADSICRSNYRETLEDIATSVVLDRCFLLEEVPPDLERVTVARNGARLDRTEDPDSPTGWYYDDGRNAVCLAGEQTRRVGDVFEISVELEARGFDEEE